MTKYIDGKVTEPEYSDQHPQRLIELLNQGMLDCHICKDFGISRETFYQWKKNHPNFEKAYAIGAPACEAVWASRMMTMVDTGNEKGFKPLIGILNNKFGWGNGEYAPKSVVNQQINIENMNVFKEKNIEELKEFIEDKLLDNPILELNQINESEED